MFWVEVTKSTMKKLLWRSEAMAAVLREHKCFNPTHDTQKGWESLASMREPQVAGNVL